MLLKEIGRKIAQAFRLEKAADEKVASSIAAALDAKAEQIKEYEKRFEPEHPEPLPKTTPEETEKLSEAPSMTTMEEVDRAAKGTFKTSNTTIEFKLNENDLQKFVTSLIGIGKEMERRMERRGANNWRKMHGLPMHRKPASFRRRRRCLDGRKGIENLQYAGEGGKAMEQESRVNNPKPWIAQIFCRHHGEWFRRQEPYFNLSGETQYKVCTKCGKKLDERFIANFDGS